MHLARDELIVYWKRINAYVVVVDEVRTGRKRLAFKTMWKVRVAHDTTINSSHANDYAQPAHGKEKIVQTEDKASNPEAVNKPEKTDGKQEAKETDNGVMLYSRSQSTQEAYDKRIDDLFAGAKPDPVNGIKVLDNSDELDLLGYGDYEMVLAEKHAVSDGMYNHGLTADDWKNLPEWLENPIAVFKRDDGHMTFIAPELKNGNPIVIGVSPKVGGQGNRSKLLHVVLTAYEKDSGKLPIARMIKEGNLVYLNTRKSLAFNRGSGLQLPSSADEFRGSKQKIYFDRDLVKYRQQREKNSLSQTANPVKNPHTISSLFNAVRNTMDKAYGESWTQRLLATGKFKMISKADAKKIAGETGITSQGFYNPADNTTYLVADNISKDTDLKGLILHEIGVHALNLGKDDAEFKAILNRLVRLKSLDPNIKAAFTHVPENTPPEHINEEALGYLVEHHPDLPIIKKLLAWFRDKVRSINKYLKGTDRLKLMKWAKELTPDDLIYMAGKALRSAPDSLVFEQQSKPDNKSAFDSTNHAIHYSFAGVKSKVDQSSLEEAKHRLAKGDYPEQIRAETGWFKGNEGLWRYELDSRQASLKKEVTYPSTLDKVLNYPVLFEAYPHFKTIKVETEAGSGASFYRTTNTIAIGIHARNPLASILHEVQHAIQKVEGFSSGSNEFISKKELLAVYSDDLNKMTAVLASAEAKLKALNKEWHKPKSPDYDAWVKQREDLKQAITGYKAEWSKLNNKVNDDAAFNHYYSKPGEIEARNVEYRQPLSVIQREAMSPAQSEKIVGKLRFSQLSVANPKGLSEEAANLAIEQFKNDFNGVRGVVFRVYKNAAEAFGNDYQATGKIKGFYTYQNGQNIIGIFRDSLDSVQDATETLRHETLAHFGLNLLSPTDKLKLLATVIAGQSDAVVGKIFKAVAKDYPELVNDEFKQWAKELTADDLIYMAGKALRSAPDSLAFDKSSRNNNVFNSKSAMKSVVANIRRGREAMTKALLNRSTVHRAMFRSGMGWVDFVWGDECGNATSKGKRSGAKGLAHIIEARQRKDGLSEQQTKKLLFDLVDTIAKGKEIAVPEIVGMQKILINDGQHEVVLVKRSGSNSCMITGYELYKSDDTKAGGDAIESTRPESTLARNEVGADDKHITQNSSSSNDIVFNLALPLLAPNGKPSNLNAMQYAQVRTQEFKAWFGDWDRLIQYSFLTGKSVVSLSPKVNGLIDELNIEQESSLKDAIFQLYLTALPEQSMRKHYIHRKTTA